MFKKLKDKLAEEVKSSPQRIQQFAQAAQAAVTSASSSISDITNNDLFSIGDNDTQQARANTAKSSQQNTSQDVALLQSTQSTSDASEYSMPSQDMLDNQRLRRLSNSSFASDVSFRLPSYETPSVYHLQSDMEVSASEAEERSFSSGAVSLDRVTKEQLYAAYRRTQERYTKYRTQYSDLARHYKLLERENAKARSVLVETQDKALRRISELREQCSLEQSAKAHLEKALRVDIEEKNMKIEALNTKVQLLQNDSDNCKSNNSRRDSKTNPCEDVQLINLSNDNASPNTIVPSTGEVTTLNNKIEKMEQLLNKYKESLKTSKEKNAQMNSELQILTNEMDKKNKELEEVQGTLNQLVDANKKIQELNILNEDLQNKINVYEFRETKELSTLELDFEKAQEEISELRKKIEVFSKREEDYAISLAENKLSIHKELESKESEIKSLKDKLDATKKEIQSLNIVISDYKNNITTLEAERAKLSLDNTEINLQKNKIIELESQLEEFTKKFHNLEQHKAKADESYKCLQLQLNQETAEKLATIDRNVYLENRNTQLSEENAKKSTQISHLENEILRKDKDLSSQMLNDSEKNELYEELRDWKDKYTKLESEIQEERDELIKLQSEIEKLLANHELLQTQNSEFRKIVSDLRADNEILQDKLIKHNKLRSNCLVLAREIKDAKKLLHLTLNDAKSLQKISNEAFNSLFHEINYSLKHVSYNETQAKINEYNELKLENDSLKSKIKTTTEKYDNLSEEVYLLREENKGLKFEKSENELRKGTIDDEVEKITVQYNSVLNELNLFKENNECLSYKINEFEKNFQNLQMAIEFEKSQKLEAVEKVTLFENEKLVLTEQLRSLENECVTVKKDLEDLKNVHENDMAELVAAKNENNNLLNQIELMENSKTLVHKLQEDIQSLTLENVSIKTQAQKLAESYNKMELEIHDVRKSHAVMETEKDQLNKTINELENNLRKEMVSKDIQTEEIQKEQSSNELYTEKHFENSEQSLDITNETGKMKAIDLQEIKSQQSLELNIKYTSLKSEYDSLKEENKRLKSDIEGLQTYLMKISKENSVLNDKIRELIVTSEHSTDSKDTSDLSELRMEIQSVKEKCDDLQRDNTLLLEENLELKDQLQSHNYSNVETRYSNSESGVTDEKYNNLLQVNSTLEKRICELELMNKSFNGNIVQVQDKNEKLRLSNEKLERRLDEALVSLRHLHSLQENTELEYLRNILYEYLTGSGTHSVTLAKVLAAIVKFDDMQTKLVLQKEKERQGFLRQLGII